MLLIFVSFFEASVVVVEPSTTVIPTSSVAVPSSSSKYSQKKASDLFLIDFH